MNFIAIGKIGIELYEILCYNVVNALKQTLCAIQNQKYKKGTVLT